MSRYCVDSLVRVRPVLPSDKTKNPIYHTSDVIVHIDEDNQSIQLVRDEFESKKFCFRCVLGPTASQVDVYRHCKDIVTGFLDGYNGCILAYGATGTGKSYTIFGNDCERNPPFPATSGLMQMASCDILSSLSPQDTLYLSFYEIYCDELTDLLVDKVPMDNSPLHIRETKDGVSIEGLCQVSVTLDTVFPVIHKGIRSRRASSTSQNVRSSRSHAIVELTLERKSNSGRLRRNVLTFGDLAGSERIKRATVVKQQIREAKAINTSIIALGNCIQQLSLGKSHIPYRDSKLTRLLAPSLGGNSHTCFISTIGPCGYHYEESYSTLTFATKYVHAMYILCMTRGRVGSIERMIAPTSYDVSSSVLSERMKEWKWPAKLFDDIPPPNTLYVDNDCLSTSVEELLQNSVQDAVTDTQPDTITYEQQQDRTINNTIPIDPPDVLASSPPPSPESVPSVSQESVDDYCYVLSEADCIALDGLRSPIEENNNLDNGLLRYESIGESGSEGSSVDGVLELGSDEEIIENAYEEEEYSNDNNGYYMNDVRGSDASDDVSDASEDVFRNVYICDASTSPTAVLHDLERLYAENEYEIPLYDDQSYEGDTNDDRCILQMRHLTAEENSDELVNKESPVHVEYSSIRLPHIPTPPSHSAGVDVIVSKVALSLDHLPPPPSSPIASSPKAKTCLECQYAQEEITYLKEKVAMQNAEIIRLRQLVDRLQD